MVVIKGGRLKKYIVALSLLLILLPCLAYSFIVCNASSASSLFYREIYQGQGTMVQGTWGWSADALQTDFESAATEGAGKYANSATHNDLDEYKWSSIFLAKGNYKITIIHDKSNNRGIAEVLFGTTSLGTKDYYVAVAVNNQLWEVTFTLTADTTADLRFRVNSKNAAGTDHRVNFSRFQIEKVG